jgi:hypothetical protein
MNAIKSDALKAVEVYNTALDHVNEAIDANNAAYTAYIAARDLCRDIYSQRCNCRRGSSSCTGENCGDCSNCGYNCPPCNEGPDAMFAVEKAWAAAVAAHTTALAALAAIEAIEAAEAAIKALPH